MSVLVSKAALENAHGNFLKARQWAKEEYGVTARDWTTLCYRLNEVARQQQSEGEGYPEAMPQVLDANGKIEAKSEPVEVVSHPLEVTTVQIIRLALWRSLLLVLWALRDRWLDCTRLLRWAYLQCLILWENDPGAGLMREVKLAFSDE